MRPSGITKFPVFSASIAVTVLLFVGYRWVLAPILIQNRRMKQEEFADMIYEFKHKKVEE